MRSFSIVGVIREALSDRFRFRSPVNFHQGLLSQSMGTVLALDNVTQMSTSFAEIRDLDFVFTTNGSKVLTIIAVIRTALGSIKVLAEVPQYDLSSTIDLVL